MSRKKRRIAAEPQTKHISTGNESVEPVKLRAHIGRRTAAPALRSQPRKSEGCGLLLMVLCIVYCCMIYDIVIIVDVFVIV